MSVIKLSTPAASCWTTRVVEGHSPAVKPGLSENRKVSAPWLVAMHWEAQFILGSSMIFSSVLYHFYKVAFATSRLA